MSASKEKKNRFEQRGAAPDKKSAAAAEQSKKDRAFRRNTIIAVVVIIVLVAAALLINSNLFYTRTTAVQVGDTKYSPAEVSYFFKTSFNQIYNQYDQYYQAFGASISSLVDISKPLDTQQYTEDQTWADLAFEQAKADMTQITVYYDAAIKAGYTLNDEDNAQVEASLAQMRTYATVNGFSSLDKFLAAYYGKGVDEALFTALSEKVALASRYSQDLLESLDYADAELEEYYQAHAEEMDNYNLYLYLISSSNEKFADLKDDEAKKTAAHDAATEIVKANTQDAFVENVRAFTGEDTTVNASRMHASDLGDSYKEWVMSADRKVGDTTVADIDTGSYAIMFLGYDDNNYKPVAMRHILINAEADEDGVYTDEAKAAAEQKIQDILAEWETDKTEENFAALAEKYSDDTGSNTNGGLYEGITKDSSMVPVVMDFLFADGRKAGDTEVAFNDGSYVGCHLLYFVGESGDLYRLQLAKNAKTSEDFNAKYEELSADYELSTAGGLRFANLA